MGCYCLWVIRSSLYIIENQYFIFSVKEIQSTAKAYGAEAFIFEDMAHDMMLEKNWKAVADYIIKSI